MSDGWTHKGSVYYNMQMPDLAKLMELKDKREIWVYFPLPVSFFSLPVLDCSTGETATLFTRQQEHVMQKTYEKAWSIRNGYPGQPSH